MTAAKVAALRVDDIDEHPGKPGAFEYFTNAGGAVAGLIYRCPCGCGVEGALDFKPAPSPSWGWDGDRDTPTLTPSIHHLIAGSSHWHGYLRAGIFEPC